MRTIGTTNFGLNFSSHLRAVGFLNFRIFSLQKYKAKFVSLGLCDSIFRNGPRVVVNVQEKISQLNSRFYNIHFKCWL